MKVSLLTKYLVWLLISTAVSCGQKEYYKPLKNPLNGSWDLESIRCFDPRDTQLTTPVEEFLNLQLLTLNFTRIEMTINSSEENCTANLKNKFKYIFYADLTGVLNLSGESQELPCQFVLNLNDEALELEFIAILSENSDLSMSLNSRKDQLSILQMFQFFGSDVPGLCRGQCQCYFDFYKI